MPHLSPLNWILSPLIFWSVLISFSSILWWSQSLLFPKMLYSFSYPKSFIWSW